MLGKKKQTKNKNNIFFKNVRIIVSAKSLSASFALIRKCSKASLRISRAEVCTQVKKTYAYFSTDVQNNTLLQEGAQAGASVANGGAAIEVGATKGHQAGASVAGGAIIKVEA